MILSVKLSGVHATDPNTLIKCSKDLPEVCRSRASAGEHWTWCGGWTRPAEVRTPSSPRLLLRRWCDPTALRGGRVSTPQTKLSAHSHLWRCTDLPPPTPNPATETRTVDRGSCLEGPGTVTAGHQPAGYRRPDIDRHGEASGRQFRSRWRRFPDRTLQRQASIRTIIIGMYVAAIQRSSAGQESLPAIDWHIKHWAMLTSDSQWFTTIDVSVIYRRTHDFTMEGVHVVRRRTGWSGGLLYPSGVQGKAPVGNLGDEAPPPQMLKQNVKSVYNF